MADALRRHATPGATPASEQARPDQVRNNAGGYVFKVDDKARLNRFLTLGTEGGTYYVNERKLTRDNAVFIANLAEANAPFLVNDIVAVSEAGRAPRNNPALFALAAAAGLGDTRYRQGALDVLPRVARTGYHLLVWAEYIEMFRGWGPQLVKGIRNWYLSKSPEDLAYQLLKYKQREGWSQRDLIRLSGFKGAGSAVDNAHAAIFKYVLKNEFDSDRLPVLFDLAEQAHETRSVRDWVRLIESNRSLSWEMLPSEALAEREVWEAMIRNGNLPLGALLRNLARLTNLGVIAPMGTSTALIVSRLTSQVHISKARIHPLNVLMALRTYAAGKSRRGSSSWHPVPHVTDALNDMFYKAFGTVVPANKRTLIALDVSGSMATNNFSSGHRTLWNDTGLTPREITAAMSMVVAKTEPQYAITAFSHDIAPIGISATQRLDDVMRAVAAMPMGGTDCSLPMLWAARHNVAVDTFQVWTDNESWRGRVHPFEALKQYRRQTGINARLQAIGVAATPYTIADPLDPGQLDVSGFDSAVPNLLADHSRGDI